MSARLFRENGRVVMKGDNEPRKLIVFNIKKYPWRGTVFYDHKLDADAWKGFIWDGNDDDEIEEYVRFVKREMDKETLDYVIIEAETGKIIETIRDFCKRKKIGTFFAELRG